MVLPCCQFYSNILVFHLLPVLYQIQRNPNCWPFLEPVTRDIAPDYFDVIDKPMDISVIRRKSTRKEYSTKQEFVDDFNLIVENCTKYNGANSGTCWLVSC